MKRFFTKYLLLGIFLVLSFSLVRSIASSINADKKLEKVQQTLEVVQSEKDRLISELEQAKSQIYIEKQVRDKLGLAREGEVVILLPPDDVLRKLSAFVEDEDGVVLPKPNWQRWLDLFL